MKTIGLIGGLSWESSIEYYRLINQGVREQLGGVYSAECLMYSFNFAEIEALQEENNLDAMTHRMINAARQVERGGGDCIVICSNTMHRTAGDVQNAVDIPVLHIADATAEVIQARNLATVGLLGTRYTMEQDFYRGRLQSRYDLDVRIPDASDRADVHSIIYSELVVGQIRDDSRRRYQQVIESLVDNGAQGIILGCTEIGLLIKPEHSPVPVFDTTAIHASAAVRWALEG